MKVVILGPTGMLGSMVKSTLLEADSFGRPEFNAEAPRMQLIRDYDWVINCIGVIKPYCHDVVRAIRVNAFFPHMLPDNTIQIATDCVFSGNRGGYTETDPHDASDVYGQTKSLGEATHIKNLRCSIIGPEIAKKPVSLLEWMLKQKAPSGYTNHLWNGITTYHFSLICQGALREGIELPQMQHIVPADVVTKAELLRIIAKAYKKNVKVKDVEADEIIDRTLSTNNPGLNLKLWQSAGYKTPPTIEQMVTELAQL